MALSKCQMLTCKVAEGVISAVNCYKNNNKITREKKATSRMLNYLLNVKNEWIRYVVTLLIAS